MRSERNSPTPGFVDRPGAARGPRRGRGQPRAWRFLPARLQPSVPFLVLLHSRAFARFARLADGPPSTRRSLGFPDPPSARVRGDDPAVDAGVIRPGPDQPRPDLSLGQSKIDWEHEKPQAAPIPEGIRRGQQSRWRRGSRVRPVSQPATQVPWPDSSMAESRGSPGGSSSPSGSGWPWSSGSARIKTRPSVVPASYRLNGLSAPGLVIYFLSVSFAVIDWGMSLEPKWYSTLRGPPDDQRLGDGP